MKPMRRIQGNLYLYLYLLHNNDMLSVLIRIVSDE